MEKIEYAKITPGQNITTFYKKDSRHIILNNDNVLIFKKLDRENLLYWFEVDGYLDSLIALSPGDFYKVC